MKNAEASFFIALLERMKYYEDMSVSNFVREDSEQKRHPIVWEETNEKNGFPLIDPNSDEIGTDTAWQFCLQDGKGRAHHSWRVHGFLKDSVFHIVWLDDSHRLTGIENGFKKKK